MGGPRGEQKPAGGAAFSRRSNYMGILAENGQSVQRPTMRRAALVGACYSPTAETIATAKDSWSRRLPVLRTVRARAQPPPVRAWAEVPRTPWLTPAADVRLPRPASFSQRACAPMGRRPAAVPH